MGIVRVSFDLDGVLYEKPDLYIVLCRLLKQAGAEIGVLTGHRHSSRDHVFTKLRRMGFPDFDFYFGREGEELKQNGAVMKSKAIDEYGISVHFDDYDFDYPETIRLFKELGMEDRIIRVRSVESGKLG